MAQPTIVVSNLVKTYRVHKKAPGLRNAFKSLFHHDVITLNAVNSISFTVAHGELIGFLGPNGAGKTTTLKMLAGILTPTSGSATVFGFLPWERKKEYQKRFALIMGQKNQLWWDLPAEDSFLLHKAIYEIPDQNYHQTLAELTTALDVQDILNIPVRKLSLGQRMKCELIAGLLHEPEILFLDEPTIGLDVVSQQAVREFIRSYNAHKKTTIVLTSHYMEDVEQLCRRIIIIDHGAIVYDGSLASLKNISRHKIIDVTFHAHVARKDLESQGTLREYTSLHATLRVDNDRYKASAQNILSRFPVDDILINDVPIEEIIRDLFQRQQPQHL